MAESSTHINYSFEEIQRYLQGKMSATEMHEIEKAALQDSFLADAIEGFNEADLTTAQQHLNEINASLNSEKKESKIIAFNRKTQWLNIAAVIIVLAGIGLVASYFLRSTNKQTQIAQTKKQSITNNVLKDSSVQKLNAPMAQPDSTYIAQNKNLPKASVLKPSASLKKESANGSVSSNKNVQSNEATATAADIIPTSPTVQNQDAATSFAVAPLSNQIKDSVSGILHNRVSGINVAPTIFSGKVVDEKNQPMTGVIVQSTDKSITVFTNNNGDFSLFKSDTVLNAVASTVGYSTKYTALKPGNDNVIRLTQNSSALNEVVIVGYASKKIAPANKTATPVGGWQNFNNYVLNKLNKDSTNNNFMSEKDQVEMEFLVDNDGNPYNIKITKPLDEQRNQKAIEILKNGPKWTNVSKKKKAKIAISF